MKLATYKNGTRDGLLVVVSRDLELCIPAGDIAPTLQSALDNWEQAALTLGQIYQDLNRKGAELAGAMIFDQEACESPLPRSYQWADGSAYVNHVELVRKARGAELPESFWSDPLMYQGGSDSFIGPREDIPLASEDWGIDFEAEIAVITDDTPMGVSAAAAADHIKLLMLVNDVSLRGLIPAELAKGFGFFQSKPSSAFSPVAVTPDELGASWTGGKVHLPLQSWLNGELFGKPEAGVDMTFSFPEIVAHAAKTRPLGAGAIVGSGTVSNKLDGGPGKPVSQGGLGYSCLAEIRMIETIAQGAPVTPFMKFGDRVAIEMQDKNGQSIFGRIDQQVVKYQTR
ncbi:fumarylacetoacetate hydrolase family protein [Kiloniella laminariae]|uniref:Fumarylacetoacetate hydrolase family protein n=1 Tax=Kiloniella laminariae TaxID=454162 RepID=A0ABT4LMV9_9PROT|nr:fumarylacetoacetate hydrolase family protein [Kiloniella laminariae]MCZ4282423.1 fumarylacetoacetate hydrolase family protein [Kiloniella laminariae]